MTIGGAQINKLRRAHAQITHTSTQDPTVPKTDWLEFLALAKAKGGKYARVSQNFAAQAFTCAMFLYNNANATIPRLVRGAKKN